MQNSWNPCLALGMPFRVGDASIPSSRRALDLREGNHPLGYSSPQRARSQLRSALRRLCCCWNRPSDWFWFQIHNKFQREHTGRTGLQESDLKDIRILIRVATWIERGVTYEADRRRVEICLQEVGLKESRKQISIPMDRSAKEPRN